METLVVERTDSIAHDLVGQLENGLANEPSISPESATKPATPFLR